MHNITNLTKVTHGATHKMADTSSYKAANMRISPLLDMRAGAVPPAPVHTLPLDRPNGGSNTTELSPMHDFMNKLLQDDIIEQLKKYVRWQADWREGYANGMSLDEALETAPDYAPLSINLDLTTACNYRCGHCVDLDILNTNIRHDHENLMNALTTMADRGLKSVIIIGGGEPTAYPAFGEVVRHLKARDIRIGVVTNGSLMKRIEEVSDVLGAGDWVRLSLDSADNDTFTKMHRPGNKKCTLDWICEHIPPIKEKNPAFAIGFSFIVVWDNCSANNEDIIDNTDEIYRAAERAKKYAFDYISFKPFLTRAEENNAEVVDLTNTDRKRIDATVALIRREVDRAKALEDENFRVVESTNLRVLENNSYRDYTQQPRNCHMQFFRQVLSPLGTYNCPVYRHVPQALIGDKNTYATADANRKALHNTLRLIEAFDSSSECREVTCLYNNANWFIEDLIRNPEKLDELKAVASRKDYFL